MRVDDAHELHAGHGRQDARVVPAEVADADDADTKRA
jgi:hypothetical protein